MSRKIHIFDTTLRDGEQVPGAKLNKRQKIEIAQQLARLGVDVIEAGFPCSSPEDLNAVKAISQQVKGPIITGLARVVKEDIELAWEAVRDAERPRIHVFLGSSDVHLKKKLGRNRESALEMAVEAVKYAKSFCHDVEYSAEDASRTDFEYMCRIIDATIRAGATVVNVPDTVGYAVPEEFGDLIRRLREKVPPLDKVILSVHCHDDLGLAVANSLSAIRNGADQVECTINGVGERAGNASLEEIRDGSQYQVFNLSGSNGHQHPGDIPNQPHGQQTDECPGAAEQGNRGQQCLCSFLGNSPGWDTERKNHL